MYSVSRKLFITKSSNASTVSSSSSSSGRRPEYKPRANVQCTYCHGLFFSKDAYKVHKDHCEPRRQWWLKYSQELPGRL